MLVVALLLLLLAALKFDVKSDVLNSLPNDGDVMKSGSERKKLYQPKSKRYHDESDVVSVVQILTQNILQWSFVESQLSEPQVNLNIPEIAVPLRHLSSSLVLLGSVLHSRNDLYESKIVYERACPLIEITSKVDKAEIDDCFNKLTEIYDNIYNQGGVRVDTDSDDASTVESDAALSNTLSYKRKNRKRNHILNIDEIEEEDKTLNRASIVNSNSQNNDTEIHNARIQKSSLYSLLTEINVYDNFEIENQNAKPGYFNASLRINELRSLYDHVRRSLQSPKASSPPLTSAPESEQYDIEVEAFWDIPAIRARDTRYDREQSKQTFLHVHSLVNAYVRGDDDGQNALIGRLNDLAEGEVHPIYTILTAIMTDIHSQASFDHYFDVLEDFFDLVQHSRESFLDAMASIESMPLSVETQLKLIIIYMFDKAYIDSEQGKVFNYTKHELDDASTEEEFLDNDFIESPITIDFERFADELSIEPNSNIHGNTASTKDSMSFLLCFLLFVTLLISIGVYQQVLRNRHHSHRQFRARKTTNKSSNDDDLINQIYSFINNDCRKSHVDSDASDSDSRLLRQKVVAVPASLLSGMYETMSYYLNKVLQGTKYAVVDNSNTSAPSSRVSSKKNKTTSKMAKKGNNTSGSSASITSCKGKGTGKSTSQLIAHQESDSSNDDVDSDDDIISSDGEKAKMKTQVATTATITNITAIEDDNNEWVHAGKSCRSTKAPSVVTLATSTNASSSAIVNPSKVKKEPSKLANKTLPRALSQSNVTKDVIAARIADMSYTAIVKFNEAVDIHGDNMTKPSSQSNEEQLSEKADYFGEHKLKSTEEVTPVATSIPEDDDESLLMSIHALIDSSLMNAQPDMTGPPGFENHSTGLWGLSGGSSLPTYWNSIPAMGQLDGLFMSNPAKLYPQSDLNLDAPTFVPTTPLAFLPDENLIIVTVNCSAIGDPSFIKSAMIVLMGDALGNSQTIGMSRCNFKPSLWTARVSLPFRYDDSKLNYKYYVEDINKNVWGENQIEHSIDTDYARHNGVQDSFAAPICK